jgi:hypothetical protein
MYALLYNQTPIGDTMKWTEVFARARDVEQVELGLTYHFKESGRHMETKIHMQRCSADRVQS